MGGVEWGVVDYFQKTGRWDATLSDITVHFNTLTIESIAGGKVADRISLLNPPLPTNAAGEQMLALTTNQCDDTPSPNFGRWVVWHYEPPPPAERTTEQEVLVRRYLDFETRPLVRTEWLDESEVEKLFTAIGKKPPNGGIWKLPGERRKPLNPADYRGRGEADPNPVITGPLTRYQLNDLTGHAPPDATPPVDYSKIRAPTESRQEKPPPNPNAAVEQTPVPLSFAWWMIGISCLGLALLLWRVLARRPW